MLSKIFRFNFVSSLFLVFLVSFCLNLIWENLHSVLYAHYKSGDITELILLRAALFDAAVISALSLLFFKVKFFSDKTYLLFVFGLLFAIYLEIFALGTGRWAYNELMPLIPILKVGLTPTIQLGFLGWLSFKAVVVLGVFFDKNEDC